MKNLLFFICIWVVPFICEAQITISPLSSDREPICPGQVIAYSLKTNGNSSLPASTCTISWVALNGRFVDFPGQPRSVIGKNLFSVNVAWDDDYHGGNLTVSYSCPDNSSGDLASADYAISTFFGQPVSEFADFAGSVHQTGSINIPYCVTSSVYVYVDHIYMNNTGGVGQATLVEAKYLFTLPCGWQEVGTNRTGQISTTVNGITIAPIPGPTAGFVSGSVRVVGQNPLLCGSSTQAGTIALNRTGAGPTLSISPSTYTGPYCGNRNPLTFIAPNFSCGIPYSWTIPSGWTISSSSSNSIVLIPTGTSVDGGATVKASLALCSGPLNYTYVLPSFTKPQISGPSVICSSSPLSISNIQTSTITWVVDHPEILQVDASGNAIRNGNASGRVNLQASSPVCDVSTDSFSIYVGIPDVPATVVGNSSPNIGYTEFYYVPGISDGTTGITWRLPRNGNGCNPYCWSLNRLNSTTSIFVNVGTTPGYLQAIATNSCGSGGASSIFISPIGVPGCNPCQSPINIPQPPNPNPADKELHVGLGDSENEKEVILISDKEEKIVDVLTSEHNITIPVSTLREGVYYLQILSDGQELRHRVVIKH
jgi:hypothetical protein